MPTQSRHSNAKRSIGVPGRTSLSRGPKEAGLNPRKSPREALFTVSISTIQLQIPTSYRPTALTTGALSGVGAADKTAIMTPPSYQVPELLSPPVHAGLPIGAPGADVKGAALNYSGNVDLGPAVKG